jgi:hypothetical protein
MNLAKNASPTVARAARPGISTILGAVAVALALAGAIAAAPTGARAASPVKAASTSPSAACPTPAEQGPSSFPCDVIGSSHMAATYGFGSECSLQEGARRLLALGTRVIKVSTWELPDRYRFNCDWTGLSTATPPATIVATPQFRELFSMPFSTFVMQTFSSVNPDPNYWRDGVTDVQCATESSQMYDLARELLTTYGSTRKEFVVQNWESDWGARGDYDPDHVPGTTAVAGLIRWFNCRQDGLDRARADIQSGARVLQGCEVNLVDRALKGLRGSVIDEVIPYTHCDLVSYSAWDTLSYAMGGKLEEGRAKFRAALDHIAAMTPDPSPYVREAICPYPQNVYVGEYGTPENEFGNARTMATIKMATEESLRWGARWTIFWQLYDNELREPVSGRPTDGDVRGYWLVKPSGGWSPAAVYLGGILQAPANGAAPCPPTSVPAPPRQPPPGPPVDSQPPRVAHIHLRPRRLSLHVSEAATVRATIARRVRHGKHHRWRAVARLLLHSRQRGRIATKLQHLRRGRYLVKIHARDPAGNATGAIKKRARIPGRRHHPKKHQRD